MISPAPDSQEQPHQRMNSRPRGNEQEALKQVLIIEAFRQYLEEQLAIQQKGATSVIGVTLFHPERAPAFLCTQWKYQNAIAFYLARCFPERQVQVDYDQVQFDSPEENGAKISLSLDTPSLCWVTLFMKASDALAAGNDLCVSAMTAAQGLALLELVEDMVTRFVSQ